MAEVKSERSAVAAGGGGAAAAAARLPCDPSRCGAHSAWARSRSGARAPQDVEADRSAWASAILQQADHQAALNAPITTWRSSRCGFGFRSMPSAGRLQCCAFRLQIESLTFICLPTISCFSVGYTQPLRRCVRCMCVGLRPIKQNDDRGKPERHGGGAARKCASARRRTQSGSTRSGAQASWPRRRACACCCKSVLLLLRGRRLLAAVRALGRTHSLTRSHKRGRAAASCCCCCCAGEMVRRGGAQAGRSCADGAPLLRRPGVPPRSLPQPAGPLGAFTGPPARSSPPARARLQVGSRSRMGIESVNK